MGIRFFCPNGHKLNVKEHLAGKRGLCPQCGAKFTIPLPMDLQAGNVAQPAGVGQSQSIEVALSPGANQPSATPADAPSVIIPVTEADLAPPPAAPSSARGPEVTPGDALPASILGGQPPTQPGPSAASADAVYSSGVGRRRRNQILVSLLLFALVIVLAGVLVWVLKREATSAPVEKKTATIDPVPRALLADLGA